jgi:ketosteroid isomerase-like protein
MVENYYAEDARILPPGNGEVRGRAAIREMWRGLVASGMVDLVLDTSHIEASGDLIVGTGTARATLQPAGAGAVLLEGRYTVVFRRQANGEWRNIIDMYTIDSEQPA